MYRDKQDSVLNKLQWLIFQKNQPKQIIYLLFGINNR